MPALMDGPSIDAGFTAQPSAADWARATAARAGVNPGLKGGLGNIAQTGVGWIAARATPGGCTQDQVDQRVNDALNWGNGALKIGLIGAATFLGDGIGGVAMAGAIASYQQATGGGCTTPDAPAAPSSAYDSFTPPGMTPAAIAGGGLTPTQATELDGMRHTLLELASNVADLMDGLAVWCSVNPLFLVSYAYKSYEDSRLVSLNSLKAVDPADRGDGESTVDFLNRVASTYHWRIGAATGGTEVGGAFVWGTPLDDTWNHWAMWPWDVWGSVQTLNADSVVYTPSSGLPVRPLFIDLMTLLRDPAV
jgi:hypothetical protein